MTRTAIRWTVAITAIAILAIAVALLLVFDPNQPGNPFPRCAFNAVTGFFCAGCGLTRAAHALVHGDLATAFSMNAYAFIAGPIVGLIILQQLKCLPVSLERYLAPFQTAWFWVGGIAAFWLLRNLPWYPFTLLAPM